MEKVLLQDHRGRKLTDFQLMCREIMTGIPVRDVNQSLTAVYQKYMQEKISQYTHVYSTDGSIPLWKVYSLEDFIRDVDTGIEEMKRTCQKNDSQSSLLETMMKAEKENLRLSLLYWRLSDLVYGLTTRAQILKKTNARHLQDLSMQSPGVKVKRDDGIYPFLSDYSYHFLSLVLQTVPSVKRVLEYRLIRFYDKYPTVGDDRSATGFSTKLMMAWFEWTAQGAFKTLDTDDAELFCDDFLLKNDAAGKFLTALCRSPVDGVRILHDLSKIDMTSHELLQWIPNLLNEKPISNFGGYIHRIWKASKSDIVDYLRFYNYQRIYGAANQTERKTAVLYIKAGIEAMEERRRQEMEERRGLSNESTNFFPTPSALALTQLGYEPTRENNGFYFSKEPAVVRNLGNMTSCCYHISGESAALVYNSVNNPIAGNLVCDKNPSGSGRRLWFSYVWEYMEATHITIPKLASSFDEVDPFTTRPLGLPLQRCLVLDNIEGNANLLDKQWREVEQWADKLCEDGVYQRVYLGVKLNDLPSELIKEIAGRAPVHSKQMHMPAMGTASYYHDDSSSMFVVSERKNKKEDRIIVRQSDDLGDIYRCCYMLMQQSDIPVKRLLRAAHDGNVSVLIAECGPSIIAAVIVLKNIHIKKEDGTSEDATLLLYMDDDYLMQQEGMKTAKQQWLKSLAGLSTTDDPYYPVDKIYNRCDHLRKIFTTSAVMQTSRNALSLTYLVRTEDGVCHFQPCHTRLLNVKKTVKKPDEDI